MYMFLAFGAAIALITIIKPFMTIYVGAEFVEAWRLVPLLLVSAVFSAISSYFGSMYGALKKSVNVTVTTLMAAIVNIIVNFICIPRIGVFGAVVGTVAAYVVIAFARMWDVWRYLKFKINLWQLLENSCVLFAQAILVTLNVYMYVASVIALILFVLINFSTIKDVLKGLRQKNIL